LDIELDPSTIGDLIVNLVAAAIGFLVAQVTVWLRFLRRTRAARRFWKPLLQDDTHVVLPIFSERRFRAWERSGLVGTGDIKALVAVQRKLLDIRREDFFITYASDLKGDELSSNLVLIGGPDSNKWTKTVLERSHLQIFVKPGTIIFTDRITGTEYCPSDGDEIGSGTDTGLVVRTRNPFNPESLVLVLAGGFGEGTEAAARLVCDPLFEHFDLIRSGLDFELLFTVEIVHGVPQRPEVLILREIPQGIT
jgi:hypothetical protein